MEERTSRKEYYLSNRELLIIAIISGIGGVMSTYIGYLGNLLNRLFGIPFGAGQFASGLHVFWFILAAGLIRKPGAATAAGLLKGIIELLTGSTHGVAIILVSLAQGLLVDVVLWAVRRHNLVSYILAGGVAAASNVFVFQLLYFSHAPVTYILFMALLAFISGALLAGSLGYSVLEVVLLARPFRFSTAMDEIAATTAANSKKKAQPTFKMVVTAFLVAILSMGAVYYFAVVYEPPWAGPRCQVEGAVKNPLSFQLSYFKQHETTITAELIGQITNVPPKEYTGIPLKTIITEAEPLDEAQKLKVIASDGYEVEFDLEKVLNDDKMVLIKEDDMLRLIAGNYEGGHWVKLVNRMVVE
jgi:energy-coupling factor transport system substrate-specific component